MSDFNLEKYLSVPSFNSIDLMREYECFKLLKNKSTPLEMISFSGVQVDSRRVQKDALFIAIPGQASDGHRYAKQAEENGAAAIVVERLLPDLSLPQILVHSCRAAWSVTCRLAWLKPDSRLRLIGVTGTNGKTSTVWMISELLSGVGIQSASLGTLGLRIGSTRLETMHTTPDPDRLFGLMQFALDQGVVCLAMEVSSHSIAQNKITPLEFDAAIFTSFSQDHLDLHGTMEEYFRTKMSLFNSHLKPKAISIIHDSVVDRISSSQRTELRPCTYGMNSVENTIDMSPSKRRGFSDVRFKLASESHYDTSQIPFIGSVFSENFLGALIAANYISNGLVIDAIRKSTVHLTPVPGRMNPVVSQQVGRPLVLVDYAHSPDALEKALISALKMTPGRLFVVFGCGGDRDQKKRPLMGAVAAKLSDVIIVTSDNPRNESPSLIIDQILSGVPQDERLKIKVIEDRRKAIKHAITASATGDCVLIAGKGHEDYQIIQGQITHFSDVEEAKIALSQQKSWLIVGAGKSGVAAAKLLHRQDDEVLLTDSSKIEDKTKRSLLAIGIKIADGSQAIEQSVGAQSIIVSPGVPQTNALIVEGKRRGIPILSEIDIGLEQLQGQIIGITGTNGKSTTCMLVDHVLKSSGLSSEVCGNIGVPPSSFERVSAQVVEYFVCELSSYQLEYSRPLKVDIGIFTSFSSDHLTRHGTLKNYFLAKWRLFSRLESGNLCLIKGEVLDLALQFGLSLPPCKTIVIHDQESLYFTMQKNSFSADVMHVLVKSHQVTDSSNPVGRISLSELSSKGLHNEVNAAFALYACAHLTSRPIQELSKSLSTFVGLPYRCQVIGKTKLGQVIINDSKSTNMESTLVALTTIDGAIILLMGGAGKGESYRDINRHKSRIKRLIAFGASRDAIVNDLDFDLSHSSHATLKNAVHEALQLSSQESLPILFSPACASFDEFKNFEDRGEQFNAWCKLELGDLQ